MGRAFFITLLDSWTPSSLSFEARRRPVGKASFTEDFKRDAVLQITERGYPVAEVAAGLGISKYSLYEWRKRSILPTTMVPSLLRRILLVCLGAV